MKRLICLLLCGLTLLSLTGCGAPKTETLDIFAMDTYMTLAAYGDNAGEALTAASQEINRLEATLSRTIDTSDVSRLNAGETVAVQQETRELLLRALALADETGGTFDMTVAPLVALWGITSDAPHVPTQEEIDALLPLVGGDHVHMDDAVTLDTGCAVDLGGIAKGYASGQVAHILRAYDVTSAVVSLGGNVYVCGSRPDGAPWNVGIQDPAGTGYAATVPTASPSPPAATSATSWRRTARCTSTFWIPAPDAPPTAICCPSPLSPTTARRRTPIPPRSTSWASRRPCPSGAPTAALT